MPIRIEFTRMRCGASSTASDLMRLSTPARADEVATMCGSGCRASSEFTQTTAGFAGVAQHRQKRAGRADHAEVLQVEFFAPGVVGGVGERRHATLAGVVHQHVGAAEARLHCLRECVRPRRRRARRRFAPAIARCGNCAFSEASACARRSLSRPQIATEAPARRNSSAVARPMPDEPPVTTATCPVKSIWII